MQKLNQQRDNNKKRKHRPAFKQKPNNTKRDKKTPSPKKSSGKSKKIAPANNRAQPIVKEKQDVIHSAAGHYSGKIDSSLTAKDGPKGVVTYKSGIEAIVESDRRYIIVAVSLTLAQISGNPILHEVLLATIAHLFASLLRKH